MVKRKLRQAIEAGTAMRVHLISGETYEGICEESAKADYIIMRTMKGIVSFPLWAVKRVQSL